jgi:hypothetical protein
MIQIIIIYAVTPFSDAIGYQCKVVYHPEDGSSKVLRNVDIVPHHYTLSQK